MPTEIRSEQIRDQEVKRQDLNTTTSGEAVITKVIDGTNISISSTGVDTGTGDVTISVDIKEDLDMNNYKIINLANPINEQDAVNKRYFDNNTIHPFLLLW